MFGWLSLVVWEGTLRFMFTGLEMEIDGLVEEHVSTTHPQPFFHHLTIGILTPKAETYNMRVMAWSQRQSRYSWCEEKKKMSGESGMCFHWSETFALVFCSYHSNSTLQWPTTGVETFIKNVLSDCMDFTLLSVQLSIQALSFISWHPQTWGWYLRYTRRYTRSLRGWVKRHPIEVVLLTVVITNVNQHAVVNPVVFQSSFANQCQYGETFFTLLGPVGYIETHRDTHTLKRGVVMAAVRDHEMEYV